MSAYDDWLKTERRLRDMISGGAHQKLMESGSAWDRILKRNQALSAAVAGGTTIGRLNEIAALGNTRYGALSMINDRWSAQAGKSFISDLTAKIGPSTRVMELVAGTSALQERYAAMFEPSDSLRRNLEKLNSAALNRALDSQFADLVTPEGSTWERVEAFASASGMAGLLEDAIGATPEFDELLAEVNEGEDQSVGRDGEFPVDAAVSALTVMVFLSLLGIWLREMDRAGQSLTEMNRVEVGLTLTGILTAAMAVREALLRIGRSSDD